MQRPPQTPKPRYRMLAILALVAVCVIGLAFGATQILHKTGSKTPNAQIQTPSTAGQNTKGEPTSTTGTNEPGDTKSNSGGQTTAPSTPLQDPIGSFVSNHSPNLDASTGRNTMQSTCSTTSGATCTIKFTKDGVTKSLEPRKTDRGGAAYWEWKLQDIGLTEGVWHIEAVATSGSQTKTAADAIDLKVSP